MRAQHRNDAVRTPDYMVGYMVGYMVDMVADV